MTRPVDLVQPTDPDWAAFKNQDEAFFLRAASDEVRRFCGWHLSPIITTNADKIEIGQRGIIMLPSRRVTEVLEVAVKMYTEEAPVVVDPDTYEWHEEGWLQPFNYTSWPYNSTGGGYSYGYGPAYLPVYQAGSAKVVFKHGWDVLPDDIKSVVMELATQAAALSGQGGVDEIQSPGYKLKIAPGGGGLSLSHGQKNRLSSYRIGAVR